MDAVTIITAMMMISAPFCFSPDLLQVSIIFIIHLSAIIDGSFSHKMSKNYEKLPSQFSSAQSDVLRLLLQFSDLFHPTSS